MAVLKCTVCGGELEVNADMSIGVCKFCDSVITIPKEIDRKGNLYNRAIFLRQNNEFDKAVATYEDILREDNSDAEAHWGLVLSKFGIEYVSDTKTQERIPTCHRTQVESILSDPDYLAALECADIEAGRVIEKEAKRINEIQSKILEISRKEPPYDIFICYKESNEYGERTKDSVLAQELYYELQKKGYKVFFSRKTLESKLGTEYEPIIFAALNSAKVMIVLGTKAEHFNAVWVKNEWSRFSKMSKGNHKVIIPAYRDMSPYELPAELSSLQSQDMSKIGFMQDLTDGIERCMRGEADKKNMQAEPSVSLETAQLARLIKNGQTYLKLDDLNSAEEIYTTITKEYPEDYRGWWGKIICKTRNFSEVFLDQNTLDVWFRYVKQLANPEDFKSVENTYIEYTKKTAMLSAAEEVREVKRLINSHDSKIRKMGQEMQSIHEKIRMSEREYQNQSVKDEEVITNSQAELIKAESAQFRKKALTIAGCVILGVGMIFVPIGFIEMGVFCVINGGAIFLLGMIYGSNSNIKECIFNAKSALQSASDTQISNKEKYEENSALLKQQLVSYQNEMSAFQRRINDCERYLELGNDKISEFWFAKKCEAFGAKQNVDDQITEYRKAVFQDEIENKDVEEKMTITCPECGVQIIENRSEFISRGYVFCTTCGNIIETGENKELQDEDSMSEENVIICPSCTEKIKVDEELLGYIESGNCYCTNCGGSIGFHELELMWSKSGK